MIIALILGRTEQARITGALRGTACVQFCGRTADLADAASTSGVHAVLTELRDGSGAPVGPVLQALRARRPTLPILTYLPFDPSAVRELVALIGAGSVSGTVFRNVDDAGVALRSAMDTARGVAVAAAIRRSVEPLVAPHLRAVIAACASAAVSPISVDELAAALGIPRRTLVERLRRADLPAPSRILGWCRLLHAARLLDRPGYSVEQIAQMLDFPSASALHNQFRRYTDLSIAAVRQRGGFTSILAAFTQELSGDCGLTVEHPCIGTVDGKHPRELLTA